MLNDYFLEEEFNGGTKIAAAKAQFANLLIDFIDSGAPLDKFTQKLFKRLHFRFFHNREENKIDFYNIWFKDGREKWIKYVLNIPKFPGIHESTYSDVEKAVQDYLRIYYKELGE